MVLRHIIEMLQPNPYMRYDLSTYVTKDTDTKTIYFYNDGYREYHYGKIYSFAHNSNQMKYYSSTGTYKDYTGQYTAKNIPEVLFSTPNYIFVREQDLAYYIYPTDIYVRLYKEDDYIAHVNMSPDGTYDYNYTAGRWSQRGQQDVVADHQEEVFFQMGTVTEVLYKIEEAQQRIWNIHNNLRKTL